MYVSCSTMSSPPNLVLTSSSQPSTLGVGLVLSEEVRVNELAIEERRRVKQICDEDRERFRKHYEVEWQLGRTKEITPLSEEFRARQIEEQKRAKQFCNEERQRFKQRYDRERLSREANRTVQAGRGGVGSRGLASPRTREEHLAKDHQLIESNKLARQRACQEQRDKDDELLERYRLEKLQDAELRESRRRQDEQRRRFSQARGDAIAGDILRHKVSVCKPISIDLFRANQSRVL